MSQFVVTTLELTSEEILHYPEGLKQQLTPK